MNTRQIDSILRRTLLPDKVNFKGVRSANRFPSKIKPGLPACFVSNTQCDHYSGDHWVSVYVDEHGKGHYFDPFGLPPPHKEWREWFKRHCRKGVTYFKDQIQPFNTRTCGHFSVYYLSHRCNAPAHLSDKKLMKSVSNKTVVKFVNKVKRK